MAAPLNIPLHDFHAEKGARFTPFGGWNMPVQYSSILEEHRAVREAAGLFDVSHMGEFHVEGEDAEHFLDLLLVNRIKGTAVGRAVYSPMCASDGGVVDDLIVYRLAEASFLVCVNASNVEKDFGWFLKQADRWGLTVQIEDHSNEYALLALQGPKSEMILGGADFEGLGDLKRFHHRRYNFSGEKILICRTGYTGEDGFEIYLPPEVTDSFARKVLEVGEPAGLQLAGLGARDSLRLEAGLPLYGHELSDVITPLEAGLEWTVKFDKDDFIGKNALTEQKEKGVTRKTVHFRLEGRRIARAETPIINSNGQHVGHVLSGTISPLTEGPIGSALVATETNQDDLFVDLRGNKIQLQVSQPPLHKPSSR
ncbi:MAG: glycine cleavage system aminomethyltransferase GcvT [Verrucomicrobiota bacterium]